MHREPHLETQRSLKIFLDESDGAIHINSWNFHDGILAVADGGTWLMWNRVTLRFDIWCRSIDECESATEKYGYMALPLDWVISALKPHLAPH